MTNPTIPTGWKQVKLGDISDNVMYGMNSSAIKYDGKHKYIRITDINESNHKFVPNPLTSPNGNIENKFKLKKGDILFTRTGASVGKSYLYDEKDGDLYFAGFLIKFHISNAYHAFIYNQTLLKKYDNWVSSISVRSGQPGINAEEYKTLSFLLPPLPEQEKIVEVLESWDDYLEKFTQVIKFKKRVKKGLMQKLLSGKVRLTGFSGEWKNYKIGELLDYEQPTKYIVSSTKYSNNYTTPVLTAGKSFVLGYTNETEGICTNLPVIIFDDFTTSNKYVDFKFKVKSSAMKMLRSKDENKFNIKFVYERIQVIKFVIGEHKRKYLSEYQYISIKIPSYKEQTAIANILTAADQEIEALENKKNLIKQQKKFLLNNLITGKIRLPEFIN